MPTIPCCNSPSVCTDPATPITNFSSEAADAETFIGRFYIPPPFPPLGPNWRSVWCLGVCESTISQEDADQCAQRMAMQCIFDGGDPQYPVFEPNPNTTPGQPPFIPVDRPFFLNEAQSCDFECPDGNVFTYTVPAGVYAGINQATANNIALSYACNKAVDTRICIGDLSPDFTCDGEDFSATVSISMPSENFPIVVSIVAGALPVDMTLDYDPDVGSFTISGTVGVAGQYGFTVQVEDFDGNFMQKEFTLDVVEISTSSPLPDADFGVAYSVTLATGGPVSGTVTWAITSGSLPPGLTLNSATGQISGTPTVSGNYTFTVTMTDQH